MEELQALINYFIANEGPWAVLFVALMIWTTKTNSKREQQLRDQISAERNANQASLREIQKDTALILETWKIIFERELKRRDKAE